MWVWIKVVSSLTGNALAALMHMGSTPAVPSAPTYATYQHLEVDALWPGEPDSCITGPSVASKLQPQQLYGVKH